MIRKLCIFVIFALISFQVGMSHSHIYTQQEKNTQTELQHEVTVVLKLIQVHVTDKKGNPITDLSPSDFTLIDNGRAQVITEFEKHFSPLETKKLKETQDEIQPVAAQELPTQMNRKLFFVFDLARSTIQGINKSKDTALHFLDTQVLPSDEIGVLTFSQLNGLVIHEYLSLDHERVRNTIAGLREMVGRTSDVGSMSLSQQSSQAEAGVGGSFSDQFARSIDPASDYDANRDFGFFVQMEDLAKTLRYVPGYKNIILFSNGFPNYLYGQASSDAVHTGDLMFREYHDDMSKEMASSNSIMFTVNAEGRRAHIRDRDARGDYSLKNMSQVSGGQYFDNIDQHEDIAEKLQRATSNYYVVGYYISETWDGAYHEIKVEVNRKNTKVNAQRGYYSPKLFNKFTKSEKLLQLLDLALNDVPQFQEPIRLPLVTLTCSEAPDSNLAILTEIPQDKLEDITQKKAQIVTMIFDEYNFIVDQLEQEFDFSKLSEDIRFHAYIASLAPGSYRCSVVVRNSQTGKAAVAASAIEIPEPLESGFRLYPPLFLIPEKSASYYSFKRRAKNQATLSDIYPSSSHSPLIQELEKGTDKILAVVRSYADGISLPEVTFDFQLVKEDSEEKIPLSSTVLTGAWEGKTYIQTLEIAFPELGPGEYSLETATTEKISGTRFKHAQKISIK
ncbi:MAG: VWA domain-containing protein [Candidatus Aminicenantes bacterium]|nr:VWA domain-containing protein [Candidatus Aminicenantes bacterium]